MYYMFTVVGAIVGAVKVTPPMLFVAGSSLGAPGNPVLAMVRAAAVFGIGLSLGIAIGGACGYLTDELIAFILQKYK